MEHHTYRSIDLSFFRTEFQSDKFHCLRRKSDQFLSIQNCVFIAPQERCLKDSLKAVCCKLRTFLLISSNQLVELFPIVPWPQLQEADQSKGIGECVDNWCAMKSRIRLRRKLELGQWIPSQTPTVGGIEVNHCIGRPWKRMRSPV